MRFFSSTLLALSLLLLLPTSVDAQIPDNMAAMVVKIYSDPQHTQPARHQKFTFISRTHANLTVEGMTNDLGYVRVLLPKGNAYEVEMETPIGPFLCRDCKVPVIPNTDDEVSGELSFYFDNQRIELKDVNFETGKATLLPSSYARLDPVAEGMKKNVTVKIEIAGHTDNVGGDDYNMKLSQARAESVRNYLIKQGVPADRLKAQGYGKTQPKASNKTPEGRAMNRRTEARVIY